jgi:hypothetical protein
MNFKWLDIIDLLITLSGLIIVAMGLNIPTKQALKIGVCLMTEDKNDKNMRLFNVQDRVREARLALIGVILIVIGFVLQIIASWSSL